MEIGNPERAINDYTTAIQLKPTFSEAYHNRGVIYNQVGRFDDAIVDFNAVINIAPYFADALLQSRFSLLP